MTDVESSSPSATDGKFEVGFPPGHLAWAPNAAVRSVAEPHKLSRTWTFWYVKRQVGKNSQESYLNSIRQIGSFSTVEEFWHFYQYLVRPSVLTQNSNFYVFREGVRPMWEDAANRKGGKWIVRLPKKLVSRYWEDLLLAVVGGKFDVGDELTGIAVSVRYNEDVVSVWNATADDNEAKRRIFRHDQRRTHAVACVHIGWVQGARQRAEARSPDDRWPANEQRGRA